MDFRGAGWTSAIWSDTTLTPNVEKPYHEPVNANMSQISPAEVAGVVADWSAKPDISARSVLVTIFGDTVLPVTRSFWLSQLFQLTDRFGFTARLVRTSMYRLAAEDWLTNERVGRQSCYHLTDLAVRESIQAGTRIYHATPSDWSGLWSLVFLDSSGLPDEERETITEHLTWHGFVHLGRGLLGSPTISTSEVRELCELLGPSAHVPVASANFDDLEGLVQSGFFSSGLNTPEIEAVYSDFVARYEPLTGSTPPDDALDAFALRTMLVHDIRRIRLRFPDLPAQLLPGEWIGDRADDIASTLYRSLSAAAAPALSEVLDVDYPVVIAGRFDG